MSESADDLSAFAAVWSLASAVGPPIGGSIAEANWRWVRRLSTHAVLTAQIFYLNVPLSAVAFILMAIFLRVRTPAGSVRSKLARVDWSGNLLFVASITSLLLGLTWAGVQYAWSSAAVLVPIVLGGVGLVAWFFVERYLIEHPTLPRGMTGTATGVIGYVIAFLHGIVSMCVAYFRSGR